MKVLIVSNMGPKKSYPHQGDFVFKQVKALDGFNNIEKLVYHYMDWNGDSVAHKLFKYPLFFLKFILKYILSFEKFDVIHIHYYYPTSFCAVLYKLLRNANVKVVVTCHGSDVYSYQEAPFFYRLFSNTVDHWIFTSKLLKKKFFKNVEHFSILSAGYDDKCYFPTTNEKKQFDFLLIGSLNFNKGLDRLQKLVLHFTNARFALVGSGELSLETLNVLENAKNLTVFGSLNPKELSRVIASSKFLLSLSRNESFGLVIAESNAVGTPCIVTETDGSEEQLKGWPLMVSQNGIKESVIMDNLKGIMADALSMQEKHYYDLSAKSIRQASKHKLSLVVKEIIELYKR